MRRLTLDELRAATECVHANMLPTAQIAWPLLSQRVGAEVWVKHENHTPIGAFKIRGGFVYLDHLKRHEGVTGVVAATRGNHGQSVAMAARALGMAAVVVVPHGNARGKNDAMRAFGAELHEHGQDFEDALAFARTLASERGYAFVPSFDRRLVMGVASYAMELFEACADLATVYVPIGLGSGICGLISARDALGLKTEIVGVVAERAPCYALTFAAGRPVTANHSDTEVGDGVATRIPDPEAAELICAGAARVVTVTDEQMLDAMAYYYADTHNLAEGAGAAPLAALYAEREAMRDKKVGVILSGGNVDPAIYRRALARLDA